MSSKYEKYYKVLDLDVGASKEEVKMAFRELSQMYHPDNYARKSPEVQKRSEEKFKELSNAYEILKNYLREDSSRKAEEKTKAEQDRREREEQNRENAEEKKSEEEVKEKKYWKEQANKKQAEQDRKDREDKKGQKEENNLNSKSWRGILMLAAGSIFSGISIMLGAFGVHSLTNVLTEKNLSAFQTATEYMGYHGIALMLVGIVCLQLPENGSKALKKVGILFTMGILMFSGSIYVLIFDGPRALGPITPLGGLCFIAGWFIFAKVVHNHFRKNHD